jgi:hypothetical protein
MEYVYFGVRIKGLNINKFNFGLRAIKKSDCADMDWIRLIFITDHMLLFVWQYFIIVGTRFGYLSEDYAL